MRVSPILNHSPMQLVTFAGNKIHIKRDDLLNQHFSGNKARKLGYFLAHDFPLINKVVGHGSVQANSLYSLAALAQLKGWQLDFYVTRIPSWLKATPTGNYLGALKLGANIIEVAQLTTNLDDYMRSKSQELADDCLFVPEGGRCQLARYGIDQLADEIILYCSKHNIIEPRIMLPSGTGTTALFLQSRLPFKVLTCACVGDDNYLKQQFSELCPDQSQWPEILTPDKKYHFGKLYPEFYQLWQQLFSQTKIEFDLLYDPLGWQCLLAYLGVDNTQGQVIYIHQGGLVGNQSMLQRYQRKYPNL